MSGPSTAKDKLGALTKRADWLEKRIADTPGASSFDRAELSALRWAIDALRPRVTERTAELFGVDFAIVAGRHADDCDCGDATHQVVAYPATAARVVIRGDSRAQLVIDFTPEQEHAVADADSYEEALTVLVTDGRWQPSGPLARAANG